MNNYSLEDYKKVIKLKQKGLGSLRISKCLNIPRSTIEGWINQGRKPYHFSERRIRACNSKENIERLRKLSKKSQPLAVEKAKESNTKPIKNFKLTKELSYVLGVLMGDGHVSQRRLILSAIDKDFVQTFKKNLEKWSGYKTRLFTRLIKTDDKIKNRKIQWVCYLDSVKIEKFVKTFNHSKIKKDIDKICFLRGFFDSEGSFSKSYELIAYNKDRSKLKLISKFLFDLDLENKIKTYTVKNINEDLILYNYLKVIGKSRYLFYQKIGFNIQRKQKRLENWVNSIAITKFGGN
tara:strand:+ start:499 stop:1377 length:879 start_codon:yes stop_codon:yes gene_type:complete